MNQAATTACNKAALNWCTTEAYCGGKAGLLNSDQQIAEASQACWLRLGTEQLCKQALEEAPYKTCSDDIIQSKCDTYDVNVQRLKPTECNGLFL